MDTQMTEDVTNSPADWEDFWNNEDEKIDWDKMIIDAFQMLRDHKIDQTNMIVYWVGTLYEPTGEKRQHLWDNDGYMKTIYEAMVTTFQGAGCCDKSKEK